MKINLEQLEKSADTVGATVLTEYEDGESFRVELKSAYVVYGGGYVRASGPVDEVCDLVALLAACEVRTSTDATAKPVETVEKLAERLSTAYSTGAYRGGWGGCIRALRRRGLTDRQIEAVIRSKWTRWAGDQSARRYGSYTSTDLIQFMDACKMWSQVDDLTRGAFGDEVQP